MKGSWAGQEGVNAAEVPEELLVESGVADGGRGVGESGREPSFVSLYECISTMDREASMLSSPWNFI